MTMTVLIVLSWLGFQLYIAFHDRSCQLLIVLIVDILEEVCFL